MEKIVAYIKEKLKRNYEEKIVKGNDLVGLEKDIRKNKRGVVHYYFHILDTIQQSRKSGRCNDRHFLLIYYVSKLCQLCYGGFPPFERGLVLGHPIRKQEKRRQTISKVK